jgi:hypothetical protein
MKTTHLSSSSKLSAQCMCTCRLAGGSDQLWLQGNTVQSASKLQEQGNQPPHRVVEVLNKGCWVEIKVSGGPRVMVHGLQLLPENVVHHKTRTFAMVRARSKGCVLNNFRTPTLTLPTLDASHHQRISALSPNPAEGDVLGGCAPASCRLGGRCSFAIGGQWALNIWARCHRRH